MNLTINLNITVQIPEVEVQTVATQPAKQSAPEQEGFEYMQHRMRIASKIKRLFGSEAATQYLSGTL